MAAGDGADEYVRAVEAAVIHGVRKAGIYLLAHERHRTLRKPCVRLPLTISEPEPEADGWDDAEAALAAAQQMPGGAERIAAPRKAGQLRFRADERRRAIRDQEPASKLQIDLQIRAQSLLKSRS
jgi:hypothetical protein